MKKKISKASSSLIRLHPQTIKHLKRGHPWVTTDRFSLKFPKDQTFLKAQDNSGKLFCTLLHDPDHPKIKARFWSQQTNAKETFSKELENRLLQSFQKRKILMDKRERENLYLSFGEADALPGFNSLFLKEGLLIEIYAYVWENYLSDLKKALKSAFIQIYPDINLKFLTFHRRNFKKKKQNLSQKETPELIRLKEFSLSYELKLTENYDIGIYTDMASIRKNVEKYLLPQKKLLNLYAYSGAYSLLALKNDMLVTSVDLSKKAQTMFERNLQLNPSLKGAHHQFETTSVENFLKTNHENFDFIICDPPSFSSDGKKSSNVLKDYEWLLPKLWEKSSPDGRILLFCNTHKVSRGKFKDFIKKLLKRHNSYHKIIKDYALGEDCPTLKNFEEGAYLKGILLGN